MKSSIALAVASLVFSTALLAAETGPQPPRMDAAMMKAIATTLPLEGAPKAIPGPYATASEPAFGVATLKIIRPQDLSKFPKQDTLPVVVWSNGGCAMENTKNQGFYETVASHGFLVVTTTNPPADPAAAPGARPRSATAEDLTAAINWADAEDKRDGSPLQGKIETGKVAVMGQSCGGMLSVHLGGDPRVATIGVFNSGATGNDTKEQIAALHGPVLLINGGDRDPLMGLSKTDLRCHQQRAGVLWLAAWRGAHRHDVSPRWRRVGQRRVELGAVAAQGRHEGGEDVRRQEVRVVHEQELGCGAEGPQELRPAPVGRALRRASNRAKASTSNQ